MEKEIKIHDFVRPVKERFLFIILFTLVISALSGLYSINSTTHLYQSSTRILLPFNQQELINTMGVIVKDSTVLDKVNQQLSLNRSVNRLSQQIVFSSENESQIVKIMVIDANPEQSAKIANTTAQVFIKEIGNILGIYEAKVLSEAKADPAPINANPTHNVEIGFAAGLVLSIGIALFMDSLDDSMKSESEVSQRLEVPVLGSVSKITMKRVKEKRVNRKSSKVRSGALDV